MNDIPIGTRCMINYSCNPRCPTLFWLRLNPSTTRSEQSGESRNRLWQLQHTKGHHEHCSQRRTHTYNVTCKQGHRWWWWWSSSFNTSVLYIDTSYCSKQFWAHNQKTTLSFTLIQLVSGLINSNQTSQNHFWEFRIWPQCCLNGLNCLNIGQESILVVNQMIRIQVKTCHSVDRLKCEWTSRLLTYYSVAISRLEKQGRIVWYVEGAVRMFRHSVSSWSW